MRSWSVAVLLALATPAAGAARDPARVEEARRATLTDDYQTELPGGSDGAAEGAHRAHQRDDVMIDTRDESRSTDVGPLGKLLDVLLWAVTIVGGALLAFWLVSELAQYGGDNAELTEQRFDEMTPDAAVVERPLGDAEELARRGEYREAIHTLLLRTLQELVRVAAVRVQSSMTSREILARVPLGAEPRAALAGLITAVELTHFGGDDASAADYERCRSQFQLFAAAYRGTAGKERAA